MCLVMYDGPPTDNVHVVPVAHEPTVRPNVVSTITSVYPVPSKATPALAVSVIVEPRTGHVFDALQA